MPPVATLSLQQITGVSIVDGAGVLTVPAQQYFTQENALLITIQQLVNKSLGVNILTFAQINALALGASDKGFVAFVTDFAHLVYWDGAAWQWFHADRPGILHDCVANPGVGYQLCDGSATTFLVVGGATLTTSAFTTPNLAGTPAYKKSGNAYSGTLVAASAPGAVMSGSTAPGSTGATDVSGTTQEPDTGQSVTAPGALNVIVASLTHLHPFDAGTHTHSVPALAAGTLTATVDATADPEHLVVLPFVRR